MNCRSSILVAAWIVGGVGVGVAPAAFGADIGGEPKRGAAEIFDVVTVVASKVEERVGEVAGSATVIDRDEMDRRLVQSAGDLVRYEPGVSAAGEAGRFGFSGFRIRGLDGNRVAIEVDGSPLPAAFAVGSFANAGRGAVEPELLGSVEILRGPASALYGSDALGGVVELTTRSPADYLAGDSGPALHWNLSTDGRDRGQRLSGLAAWAGAHWQALALVAVRDGHELDNQGDTAADPATREDFSSYLRAVRLFDRGLLELTLDRQDSDVATDVRHLIRGPGQFASTESLLAQDHSRRTRLSLRHSHAGRLATLEQTDFRLSWHRSETVQETEQRRAADARTRVPTLRERSFRLAETRWDGEWSGRSEVGDDRFVHRLLWGVEGGLATIEERRDGRETDLVTGRSSTSILSEQLPVRDFPNSTVKTVALYLADDLLLADGRWRLQPALRWERTTTDAQPDALYLEDFPTTTVVDLDDSSWTPKLGLTRELGRGHSAYAQYAEGFRAPPFYDVNVGLRIAAFGYEAIPNPELRPERSRGVEVGWRYAGTRVSAHVAYFENRYRDLIESRSNLGRDPLTGTTIFQSVNRDRATIRGVEARWRIDLESWTSAARGWRLDGSLAWAEGEDTRRRQPLNSVDPAELNLGATYVSPGGRWSGSAVATLVSDKRGEVDTSTVDVFAPPGYLLVDLYGEWRFGENWTVTCALLNALDRKYWSYGRVHGVLSGDAQLDFHSEPGRALTLGVAWRR